MTAGRIIKNFNGYYYVETPDKEIVTCKIKGKMKQVRFPPLREIWLSLRKILTAKA